MKNIMLKLGLILLLPLTFSACSKYLEGFEEDPNNPSDAPATLMINHVETADLFIHEGELARLAGIWVRYFTGSDRQYISYETYNMTAGDFTNAWDNFYWGVLQQARIVQAKADVTGDKVLKGVAQILEAHTMGTATAIWGDIPFTQACNVDEFPNPAYDSQRDIYVALHALLDDAIANVAGAGARYAVVTRLGSWEEVAWTLKARYYLHTGDYTSALAAAQNGISDPANDWVGTHAGATLNSINEYNNFMDWNRGGYMTADASVAYQMLNADDGLYRGNDKTDESARKAFYFDDAGNCGYLYGNIDPNWCDGFFGIVADFPLVTYAENELILAECQFRTGKAFPEALDHLNNVRSYLAGFYGTTYDNYVEADFDAGGMANNGGSKNESLIEEILEEKYLNLYGQIEAWNDLRRKDNSFRGRIPATTGSSFPERFLYSQNEINSNTSTPSPIPGLFEPTSVNKP